MTSQVPLISAEQVRAARALLAWSQKDLAIKAGVAVSTIADFERGQRTPVPNNIDAIQKALEDSGIAFCAGGVLEGRLTPQAPKVADGGSPIRLVDASDLVAWADRRNCQETIAELISRLIRAEIGPSAKLRFSSGDSIQHSGWDGLAEVPPGSSSFYVPAGSSGWEIGTQRERIREKAESDYRKRTSEPLDIVAANSTFVFVTPRRWSRKGVWIAEKQKEHKWVSVIALDADDLVHWIELFPSVGTWLATLLGKRPPNVRQLDELWREWSCSTRPPLTEELSISDRDDESSALLKWLYGTPSVLSVQSDSPEESAAFVFATLGQLPLEYKNYYLSRILAVASADQARTLGDSLSPLVLMLPDADPGLATALAQRGHHVLLTAATADTPLATELHLARPLRESVRRSLIVMGVAEDDAQVLARDCNRSLAVLRRLIPSAPSVPIPKWAGADNAQKILPALLIGAWDESNTADRQAIESLTRQSYSEWINEVVAWTSSPDSPLRKVGAIWKIVSARDAWFRIAKYVSPTMMNAFMEIAIEILGEHDPLYDLSSEERWMAPLRGQPLKHSKVIREGIAETLVLSAVFHGQLDNTSTHGLLAEVVIRKLFENADARRWWSLSDLLQNIAEASPERFLDALEDGLAAEPSPVMFLFREDSGAFGCCYHSHLLWALESLAWSPSYLSRVSLILAELARRDPGGRFSNRPQNSLQNIFRLWLPHSYARLDERLAVIDRLRKMEPELTWQLMMRLIPTGHDIAEQPAKLRWRDFAMDPEEVVTYGLIERGVAELVRRLIDDAGASAGRWAKILESFSNFSVGQRAEITGRLAVILTNLTERSARSTIKKAIRRLLHDHRAYPDVVWRLPEEELGSLDRLYDSLDEPGSAEKFSWLFTSERVDNPHPTGKGWREDETLIRTLRSNALREILNSGGEQALFDFAGLVDAPGYVGFTLPEACLDSAQLNELLEHCLGSTGGAESQMARGLASALYARQEEAWLAQILDQALAKQWSTSWVLAITLPLQATKYLWDRLEQFSDETQRAYWSQIDPLWIKGDPRDLEFAAQKLIDAGRARDAVHMIGRSAKDFPITLSVKALEEAAATLQPKAAGNELTMFIYSVEEILFRLDKTPEMSENKIVEIEWMLLPLLRHSRRPPITLHRMMTRDPGFFLQVVSAVYKADTDSGVVEEPPADLERARAIATQAYQLLREWALVPGRRGDEVESAVLEEWVRQARLLCKDAGRLVIGDQQIGAVLAHGPLDPDGIWPHAAIRELIEITRSRELEKGFILGVHNKRGMTSRGLTDGGKQERELARKYREWSRGTGLKWPRVSALLDRIAKSYEYEGERHDEEAERIQW